MLPVASSSDAQRFESSIQPDLQVLLFTATARRLTALAVRRGSGVVRASVTPRHRRCGHIGAAGESRNRAGSSVEPRRGTSGPVAGVAEPLRAIRGHLSSLRNQDLGFERASLLLVTLDPAKSGYQREQLFAPCIRVLLTAGRDSWRPLGLAQRVDADLRGGASRFIKVEGFEEAARGAPLFPLNWVGPGTSRRSARRCSPGGTSLPRTRAARQWPS